MKPLLLLAALLVACSSQLPPRLRYWCRTEVQIGGEAVCVAGVEVCGPACCMLFFFVLWRLPAVPTLRCCPMRVLPCAAPLLCALTALPLLLVLCELRRANFRAGRERRAAGDPWRELPATGPAADAVLGGRLDDGGDVDLARRAAVPRPAAGLGRGSSRAHLAGAGRRRAVAGGHVRLRAGAARLGPAIRRHRGAGDRRVVGDAARRRGVRRGRRGALYAASAGGQAGRARGAAVAARLPQHLRPRRRQRGRLGRRRSRRRAGRGPGAAQVPARRGLRRGAGARRRRADRRRHLGRGADALRVRHDRGRLRAEHGGARGRQPLCALAALRGAARAGTHPP